MPICIVRDTALVEEWNNRNRNKTIKRESNSKANNTMLNWSVTEEVERYYGGRTLHENWDKYEIKQQYHPVHMTYIRWMKNLDIL